MRDIKFRFYFRDEEPFMSEPISIEDLLHEDWIEFENEEQTISLPLKDFRFFYNKNENYEIMQYTELKDKNGKEIYEGDIVKINDEIIVKVIWDNDYLGYFLYANEENSIDYFENGEQPLYDYLGSIEVIGNIYNNPELMEEKR